MGQSRREAKSIFRPDDSTLPQFFVLTVRSSQWTEPTDKIAKEQSIIMMLLQNHFTCFRPQAIKHSITLCRFLKLLCALHQNREKFLFITNGGILMEGKTTIVFRNTDIFWIISDNFPKLTSWFRCKARRTGIVFYIMHDINIQLLYDNLATDNSCRQIKKKKCCLGFTEILKMWELLLLKGHLQKSNLS